MDKKPTDFLKYGRHVKSEGKPATYRAHMKAKAMALKKRTASSYESAKADRHSAIAKSSPMGWEDPRVASSATPRGKKQSFYRNKR